MTGNRWTTLVSIVLLAALLLAGCGGSSLGKALAQQAVKAMESRDQTQLNQILEGFDELNPIEKARFATEIARQGEEVQKMIAQQLGQAVGK
jgi:hypothetical protein